MTSASLGIPAAGNPATIRVVNGAFTHFQEADEIALGVNYYFYPRLVLKCAYQINDEPGFHLHDNQFISELAWGW